MVEFYFFIKSKLKNKYTLFTVLFILGSNLYSQETFLLRYSGQSFCYTDCIIVESHYYLSGNIVIEPIAIYDNYLFFDKFPTYVELLTSKEPGFNCDWRSPPICGDRISLTKSDCNLVISNKVLVEPVNGNNSFCDKISLVATGCTGTQKFYWEYSTDGINYTKTNINTAFNQNYEFIKASFPALDNYYGNIFFRALIDWIPTTTDDNMYSNVVNYNIDSCSPLLNGDPIAAEVRCSNEPTGSVTLNFKTDITSNQKLLLNLFKDNNFMTHKFVTAAEIINKSFTWTGLAAGSYSIKYQAQTTTDSNTLVGSQPVISPAFTVANVTPLTFKVTAIQPVCTTDKGRIQISASGGTAPYFYVLDNESLANRHSFSGTYIIPDELSEGDHTVMVVDSRDCIEK